MQGPEQQASPGPPSALLRRAGSDAHPKPFPASPKLGRNLEPPRCPAAPLRCSRAPWPGPRRAGLQEPGPWGSPGRPQCEARGLPAGSLDGPRASRREASFQRRSRPAAPPGSWHHEHRRGVPHPAQLPWSKLPDQREAGTRKLRTWSSPLPLLARLWAHSRPCPR